jgi:hypothetical protein
MLGNLANLLEDVLQILSCSLEPESPNRLGAAVLGPEDRRES